MTRQPLVELVYFAGCPHVERARANLRMALTASGLPAEWVEWDQLDPAAPGHVHGYPSPTILVEGRDIAGHGRQAARACRLHGGTSEQLIRAALSGGEP